MKVADYKGYTIQFYDHTGGFCVDGISGYFLKYKDATAKIDRVVKAEVKENFPIDVVTTSMKVGKLTSYNKIEQDAWVSFEGGSRSKEKIVNYSGNPKFYKASESNLQLVSKYKKIETIISRLSNEQRKLEKELTEPITFDMSEE